ncbi:MAG: DUF4369 domain-containing protein [Petrimonas sp.]|nr:DUF4369 domain-containing protein [Petrimonas sp.]
MKKYIALFLFAAIVLSCKQQKQAEGYTINVTVPADTKGWVYLKELKGREYIALDSAQIAGNKWFSKARWLNQWFTFFHRSKNRNAFRCMSKMLRLMLASRPIGRLKAFPAQPMRNFSTICCLGLPQEH